MATGKSGQDRKKVAAKATKVTRAKTGKPARSITRQQKAGAPRTLSPFEEMDVLFDRLSRGLMSRMGLPALGEIGWPFQANAPKVDVIDREDEILVRAEIPGVTKDDLRISLVDQTLTIRAETRKEEKEENGDYFRREITTGSFQRSLTLPAAVTENEAKATFRDGVLELTLPKVEKTSTRKIRIDD